MDELDQLTMTTDPLLACCMCKRLLHEALQLKCLHNCCRQCLNTAAPTASSQSISCGTCGAITQAGSEQLNGFIDGQVQHYRSLAESRMCGVCKGNGELDKPALVWCATCRHSLCGDCIAGHRQYFRQHVTQSLEELNSLDEVRTQPSASDCPTHKKPLDIACLSCEQAKCVICWAECNEKKHEMLVVGKGPFDSYVGKFIACITAIESELLRKSHVLKQPERFLQDTKVARDRHLEEIRMRKRSVVDAVETVYQEIEFATKNAYDELEAEGDPAVAAAERIAADLSDARNYARRLVESNDKCAILNQQKIVLERLNVLLAELDTLGDSLTTTNKQVIIEESLPDDVENVIRAWIGMPQTCSASPSSRARSSQLRVRQQRHAPQSSHVPHPGQQQYQQQQKQQQCFSFGAASASLQLPVDCFDVALTQDGRSLLLAAGQHGLIELNSANGRELSLWRPSKHCSSDWDDQVQAVASLSDGGAAVSLLYGRLVLLRRRSEESCGSSTGGAVAAAAAVEGNGVWTVDRHLVDQMPWRPLWLSAHGDVLAACELSFCQRVQLLSLSSGRTLNIERHSEYRVGSLAVAALTVVTGSLTKVELGGDRRAAHVLDAHNLDADGGRHELLWRHVLSTSDNEGEEERLQSICADSTGGCLYAAVWKHDLSRSRVSALSLADGSELRRIVLSFHSAGAAPQSPLLPLRLSLCVDGAAVVEQQSRNSRGCMLLAVLCWDSTTQEYRKVTLHRSTGNFKL